MTQSHGAAHVYLREIKDGERTSLSVLVAQIPPKASVLDLGTGSGALGQYLQSEKACVVDGVTYNPAEKAHAAPFYRRLEVADLEVCDLVSLFAGQRYDFIVCADVLEHLRAPERVLQAARNLLNPGGRVLISVPNAAYAGLVGELMTGEFRYREEGLLDQTHLRFFTRRSLGRFLREQGWLPEAIDTIQRPLPESEFQLHFDSLPPAVARYLLARPDALAYQFIVNALPASTDIAPTPAEQAPADAPETAALFSLQLYLGHQGDYAEDRKLTARGAIGQQRQTVTFTLASDDRPLDAIRLDPADRPGFLQLFRIALLGSDGVVHWQWHCDTDGLAALDVRPHREMVFAAASPLAPTGIALLHGDDPWFELPIPAAALAQAWAAGTLTLEIELGWPMSADYLSLAGPVAAHMRSMEEQVAAEGAVTAAQQKRQQREAQADLARQRDHYEQALQREREEMGAALSRERKERDEALLRERNENADAMLRERKQRDELDAALQRERNEHDEVVAQKDRERGHLESDLATVRMQTEAQRLQNRALLQKKEELAMQTTLLEQARRRTAEERDALVTHLHWIENSTVFRASRPIVRLKMKIDRLRSRPPAAVASAALPPLGRAFTPPDHPVDIIVPVYRGLSDTRRCVEAVLGQTSRAAWRLVVINDASPEPEVTAWLRDAAARHDRIVLLENIENLGFVGTVNRGMELDTNNDVVLLNSDAEVANDWLDRLRRAAYSDARVASVTPFSNNATICSYPRFCADNVLPPDYDTGRLDELFAATNPGQAVDVPTGVGFCMYVRRDALDEIGLFDVETFGKGYGEENDFCRRAVARGWRNLHVLDTFVMHSGGVSFGDAKSPREQAAMVTLRRLYPDYEPVVHRFVAADPARLARIAVDAARIRSASAPVVLCVMHDRSGGTLRHVRELALQFGARAVFLMLTPVSGGVRIELLGEDEAFALRFRMPDDFNALVMALQRLGVGHVHFHHLIGHGPQIRELPQRLGVAYDFTAHDYYTMCPQISLTGAKNGYCGELGEDQCGNCLKKSPAPGGLDIQTWRASHADFIAHARHVLVPSRDAARRFAAFLPAADTRLAPHTDLLDVDLPQPALKPLPAGRALRVVVLGALSAIKGADLLEDAAREAARRNVPIEFHLLGYAYRSLRTQPDAALTVHGEYKEADLPRLLAWLQPDVAWFPAQWPETYSYTLSACMQHGLPIVAPDIGAFAERLSGRAWSWVRPWNAPAAEFVDFFENIWQVNFATGVAPPRLWLAKATHPLDAVIGTWTYATDYLQGVKPPPADLPPLSREFLSAYQDDRIDTAAEAVRRGLKQSMLKTLVRLRASPGLRTMARAVPLRLQTRVKTWLKA